MKTPKCGGTNRQGAPCGNTAGYKTAHPGTGNCTFHGGSSPNGRTHALGQQAAMELARLDVEPLADPLTQLALLAAQAVAWKDAMAAQVNALTSLRYEGKVSGEQLRAEVILWERALDRCERFLVAMARLNIDERLAEISETQGRLIVSFIIAALGRFGIDFRDDLVHDIVMGLFERVAGGGAVEVTAELTAEVAAVPTGPELSYVCSHGMHGNCRAYLRVPGGPEPPQWPNRCPCPCHEPAGAL